MEYKINLPLSIDKDLEVKSLNSISNKEFLDLILKNKDYLESSGATP